MSKKIDELLDALEGEINSAKEEKSRLKGIIETLVKQMEDDFGVSTMEEAREILNELNSKKEAASKELEKMFNKLKEQYEW